MKAIKIDAERREFLLIDVKNLHDLQAIVEGFITVALDFEHNDTLFVDDEGLLKSPQNFILWRTDDYKNLTHRVFAGNGVIVGYTPDGKMADVKMDIEMVENSLSFASLEKVQELTSDGLIG